MKYFKEVWYVSSFGVRYRIYKLETFLWIFTDKVSVTNDGLDLSTANKILAELNNE